LGLIAGLVAGGVWLALKLKTVFAPGLDEDEDDDFADEPLSYPAAGSGTGWPAGARSAENTEVMSERAPAMPAGPPPAAAAAAPPAPAMPPAPPVVASPHLASGGAAPSGQTGRLAADTPAERTGFERPQDLDATLAFPVAGAAQPARPPSPQPSFSLLGTARVPAGDAAPP